MSEQELETSNEEQPQLTNAEKLAALSAELEQMRAQSAADDEKREAERVAEEERERARARARMPDMRAIHEKEIAESVAQIERAQATVESLPFDPTFKGFETRLLAEADLGNARLVALHAALGEAKKVADAALSPDPIKLAVSGKQAPGYDQLKAARERVRKLENLIADEQNASVMRVRMARAAGLRRQESIDRSERERKAKAERDAIDKAERDRLMGPVIKAHYLSGR